MRLQMRWKTGGGGSKDIFSGRLFGQGWPIDLFEFYSFYSNTFAKMNIVHEYLVPWFYFTIIITLIGDLCFVCIHMNRTFSYIYIYIYVCVYVCVCVNSKESGDRKIPCHVTADRKLLVDQFSPSVYNVIIDGKEAPDMVRKRPNVRKRYM